MWAVVVAGGSGRRFGSAKQFARLGGCTLVERAVAAARTVASGVVAVLPDAEDRPRSDDAVTLGADVTVTGGATRAESVRRGLAAVPDGVAIVVVHDAARPLASPELFRAVVAAVVDGADGAVPAVAVTDTLKAVDGDGRVERTVPRSGLVAVQTPQAFRADLLRRAHAGGLDATDDAGLVEALGATVRTVPGEETNLKVTSPDDLRVAAALLGPAPGTAEP